MRLLLCCEFYHPSRGGVQEVMRQIAERLVLNGHDVTVATSYLPERDFDVLNGVHIRQFNVRGNLSSAIEGEADRYRKFVAEFGADAILIKAAQQWTFDALWPVLDDIRARKVFIPCGFSGLYEPAYAEYFRLLPDILRKFDHLIFYAERYRDIDFARAHGLTKLSVLPNGASEREFSVAPRGKFRSRLEIPDDAFLFLTVGVPMVSKGHCEVAEAFAHLETNGRRVSLILNGNWPPPQHVKGGHIGRAKRVAGAVAARVFAECKFVAVAAKRSAQVLASGGWSDFKRRAAHQLKLRSAKQTEPQAAVESAPLAQPSTAPAAPQRPTIEDWIEQARAQSGKQVLCTNLGRRDLIQAFFAADLFVFASKVEYSPLVLFESAAAGTPFLTVPVGNSEEIVRWTCGGRICPADKDQYGYTKVEPQVLAQEMKTCMDDDALLVRLGEAGRSSWRTRFSWNLIVPQYEAILRGDGPTADDALVERASNTLKPRDDA